MVELVPLTPASENYYGAIMRQAHTWEEGRPVRKFRNIAELMASDDC